MGTREAGQHSQSLEAWFVHAPGIIVAVPSNPYDAKGLLKSGIRVDRPVLFMENRLLYNIEQEVPDDTWTVPLGKAAIVTEGVDITVVSYGYGIKKVREAAEALNKASIEIIDLRTLSPMDTDTVIASVKKTGRLLVVHEASAVCGIGAEIIRTVNENAFDYLDAEPLVCGGAYNPMPFSGMLEDECVIKSDDIVDKIRYLTTGIK